MKRKDYVKLHTLFIKGEIMNAYRYCEKVYNGGLDSYEQFQSFINLCQNFVDICNFSLYWEYCNQINGQHTKMFNTPANLLLIN